MPQSENDEKTIYVVNHGGHTGVVVPSKDLEERLEFLSDDFSNSKYYEIGWGDKDYYQAKKITSGLTVKAAFWPTDSVMHVVSLPTDPRAYFINSKIIEVKISSQGMDYLISNISSSFKRDGSGSVIKSANGLYGQSLFYDAAGKFYMTNTCNSWVARVLDSAGLPIRTVLTLTAGSVASQTEEAVKEYLCCP